MKFEQITRNYLTEFLDNCRSAYTNNAKSIELATRPVVHKYIERLANLFQHEKHNIIVHHDVNYTLRDRPDWRLEDSLTFGVFCFGDHKSISLDGSYNLSSTEKKQVQRYLKFNRPVFVFDGIEFLFFKNDVNNPIRCSIIPKPLNLEGNWASGDINPAVETEFRKLIDNPGFRVWTEAHLIKYLAQKAKDLSQDIRDLLMAPKDSGESELENKLIDALHDLKLIVQLHHDESLSDISSCSDFISQTLTFGLFYAHTRVSIDATEPNSRKAKIREFWNDSSFDIIASRLRPFKTIIDHLSKVVKNDNVLASWYREILGVLAHAEFMGTKQTALDFHALFETFLSEFDPQTRFDRGAFYTPYPLSDWTVRFTNELSNKYFSNDMFDAADKIIDPCCGTGSFLEAIYKTANANSSCDVIGFEILPAPYALAHYRISEVARTIRNQLEVNIFLTDTLSDQLMDNVNSNQNGFDIERNLASESCTPPIKIVIGNPPSSIHSANSAPRTIIAEQLKSFRPPKSLTGDRQNIQKALQNEAYRFLRWCCERVLESNAGIVALVLPGSFSTGVSFKYAREWILENFNDIYVLEVDSDARTNDGTHSLFSVLQGRLVLFCIKYDSDSTSHVFYKDISQGTRREKLNMLGSNTSPSDFSEINLDLQNLSFHPGMKYPKDLWEACWPLRGTPVHNGVFKERCSAIKLAPTCLFFHTSKPTLLRRSIELSSNNMEPELQLRKWFAGQRRPPKSAKLTSEVKLNLEKAAAETEVSDYHFRPFVYGKILDRPELFKAMAASGGGGTRARPELRMAFSQGAVGISVAPSPKDLGATLTRFASFSWALPDNDIAARGNAMVYCDKFAFKGDNKKLAVSSNIDKDILSNFSFSDTPELASIFYIYAILSSDVYLQTFEGILYSQSNPEYPPRVPIANSPEVRKKIAELGEEIARLEDPATTTQSSQTFTVASAPESGFKVTKHSYDYCSKTLTLFADSKTLEIEGVEEDIFELKISGHRVLDKWLREKYFCYYRREFGPSEVRELIELLSKIEEQLRVILSVDRIVEQILTPETLIHPSIKL